MIIVSFLTKQELIAYNSRCCSFGDIAQLGERLNGIQEVRGSNPLISTNQILQIYSSCVVTFKNQERMIILGFSDDVILQAWQRAGGRCQCELKGCGHTGRCNKSLVWENRGKEGKRGAWEAHHITAQSAKSSTDTLSNCRILCLDCHKNTRSYGRS